MVRAQTAEVSSVTDSIMALWFEREDDQMKRKITTLKQRGSRHDRRVGYIDFKEGCVVIHD